MLTTITSAQETWHKLDSLILNGNLNPEVQKYYSTVYKAEDAIIKERFAKAAKIYEKTFGGIVTPFRYDLNNAIKCELKSSLNKQNIFRYINLLIRKGDKKEKFYNDSTLLALEFWPELKNVIDTSICIVDSSTLKFMSFLRENDQDYRLQCYEKYDSVIYNEYTIDSIKTIDSLNYERVITFIKQNDIISEEIIGGFRAIGLILIHNKHRSQVYELLYNDVIEGNLDCRSFFYQLQFTNYRFNGIYNLGQDSHGWIYNSQLYVYHTKIRKEEFDIKQIDKFREKLYYDNIISYHQKKAWAYSHGLEFFNFNLTDKYTKESILVNLINLSKKRKNLKIVFKNDSTKAYYMNLVEKKNEQTE